MAISVQLVLFLIILSMVTIVWTNEATVKIIIASLIFIPSTVQGLISGTPYSTGNVVNLSMVGYISILWVFSLLIFRHHKLPRKITIRILMCFLVIMSIRLTVDGIDFISNKILDNYFLPMLLALALISSIKIKHIPELLHYLYVCILVGAIIACVEYVAGKSLFFHDYYMETCPWYVSIYNSSKYVTFRSCSIFGHPLTGAVYYLLGIVYLFNDASLKKKHLLFAIQLMVLIAAIFSTNSRAALFGLTLYITIYLIANEKIGKLLGVFIIIGGTIVSLGSSELFIIYNTLFARDSLGSSLMIRLNALSSISRIPFFTFLFGEGYNNTSTILTFLGFKGNLEISYLIILMENGIIGFLAWLASIIFLYGWGMKKRIINGINVSSSVRGMLFIIFIVGGTSNSFGDPGTLNYIIYFLLALSYILANSKEETVNSNRIKYRNRSRIKFTLGAKI